MALLVKIRCGLACFALLFAGGAARAQARLFVTLDYSVDPELAGCPAERDFRGLISAQLDYDPFRSESEYRVVARAERSEQGIRGVVRWFDAGGADRGERELRASGLDCEAFAKALGFAIAVQLQLFATERASVQGPGAAPSGGEPSRARPSAPADAPDRRPVAPPVEPRSHEDQRALELLVGVGAGAGLGLTPRAAAEGRAFVAARKGGLALEAGAVASLRAQHDAGGGRGFYGRFALGSLAGCASYSAFFGCVVQKLGVLEVRGFGVDVPRAPAGVIAQSGVRLGAGHLLGPHAYGALRVEALATLTRWQVQLNRNDVWRVPPVALTVGGDLAALFR